MKKSYKFQNSCKFQSSFNAKDFTKTLTINGTLYSLTYAILFARKRDANNFLKKIKKNNLITLAWRSANLLKITIVNTQLKSAVLKANKFLEIAREEQSEILTHFSCISKI